MTAMGTIFHGSFRMIGLRLAGQGVVHTVILIRGTVDCKAGIRAYMRVALVCRVDGDNLMDLER